ncbi:hypothetical protein [Salinispora fenicalii]|uniref:hypothetical protein n=1 Tax=Salinispora fenicalii TaxID=1137263 RepID=UPI000489471D|nr:hypothetical protein [Salinispora fenicalii]
MLTRAARSRRTSLPALITSGLAALITTGLTAAAAPAAAAPPVLAVPAAAVPAVAAAALPVVAAPAAAAAVPSVAAVSAAAPPDVICPPSQTTCEVWDDEPGDGGGPGGGGPGDGGGGGDGGGATCQRDGEVVPCYDEVLGWFHSGDGCYYKLVEPQPEGTPDGFDWYLVTCRNGDIGWQRTELLDAPPPGFGTPPDPAELARAALASIDLLPPRAAVAPRRRIGSGLVGLPVWMWASTAQPGQPRHYFGPQQASASDRGLTVQIAAEVTRVSWDMDNGTKVTCSGPGTAYESDSPLAGKRSPDCGYHSGYPEPGTYEIQATTHWTVSWSGGGESGSFEVTRTSGAVTIEIDELQVVTQ